MGLLGDGNAKKKESEDTLKVLATNIETINQRLAMTSPEFGFAEYQESVKKSLESIWSQLANVTNMIKTSEMGLRQLINYSLSQNEGLQKEMKKNSIDLKEHISTQKEDMVGSMNSASEDVQNAVAKYGLVITKISQDMMDFKKSINSRIAILNGNIQKNIQASGSSTFTLQHQLENMKGDMHTMITDFNKGMTEKIKSGENVDPSVIKEMKSLKSNMKNLFSDFSSQIKEQPQESKVVRESTPDISPQLMDEIEILKKEINEKFGMVTDVLRDLVDTNREYVHYLKD